MGGARCEVRAELRADEWHCCWELLLGQTERLWSPTRGVQRKNPLLRGVEPAPHVLWCFQMHAAALQGCMLLAYAVEHQLVYRQHFQVLEVSVSTQVINVLKVCDGDDVSRTLHAAASALMTSVEHCTPPRQH